jgi:hypothetical protein
VGESSVDGVEAADDEREGTKKGGAHGGSEEHGAGEAACVAEAGVLSPWQA